MRSYSSESYSYSSNVSMAYAAMCNLQAPLMTQETARHALQAALQ